MTILGAPLPFVSAEVDLRDVPTPREDFARAAVELFGIDISAARQWTNQAADRFEKPTIAAPRATSEEEQ